MDRIVMPSSNIKPEETLPASLEDSDTEALPHPEWISINPSTKFELNYASTPTTQSVDAEYPSGLRLVLIIVSAYISVFLVSLVSIFTHLLSSRPSK
jgi:hypothetical protein